MAMLPIVLKFESADGHVIEFVPSSATPLSLADLHLIDDDDSANLRIELDTNDMTIDGGRHQGSANVNFQVAFQEPVAIYGLVPRGWLPMPFVGPPRFLVDSNVVIRLRQLREGKLAPNGKAIQWWTNFFASGGGLFNPLPYAFEGGPRRKPSMAEFVAAYEKGVSELRAAMPGSEVVTFDDAAYKAAYALLEAFDEKGARQTTFLQKVCPIIAQRVPQGTETRIAEKIIAAADSCSVDRASLVVMTVLSCLYEDVQGARPSIGRMVIKPTLAYSEADAFNAISDLRHVELVSAGQGWFGSEAFALCTCDRGLARLWTALSPVAEVTIENGATFTLDFTNGFFGRLDDRGLLGLRDLLRA